jgi:hypothetical protein
MLAVVIVVFDMSNIASLRGAILWKEEACLKAETDHKEQFVFLVGSKKDLLVSKLIFQCN